MIPTAQADALLGRLAEALGRPVEIFFAGCGPAAGSASGDGSGDASPECDALPTLELLRLWEALREPVSRQRVLAAARQEARTLRAIRPEDAAAG
ncbi:hypothetical protein LOK46_08990 [Methylobacterium sp. NMS14P]|uniref:hypothetical protein n=1 Tax=Methylobacterium sp. NMS14P TaxID=2894310 RepID=UPI002358C899|nr:hypothetical protein [Methylobacterium sp. NMS14P]WCS26931.1 hypothetical protein LOK46_08990 [Methylobacterium sp. NMS14P]